jgi:hypothetical protein
MTAACAVDRRCPRPGRADPAAPHGADLFRARRRHRHARRHCRPRQPRKQGDRWRPIGQRHRTDRAADALARARQRAALLPDCLAEAGASPTRSSPAGTAAASAASAKPSGSFGPMSKANRCLVSTGAARPATTVSMSAIANGKPPTPSGSGPTESPSMLLQVRRCDRQQGEPRPGPDAGAGRNPVALGRAHRLPRRDGTRRLAQRAPNGWRWRLRTPGGRHPARTRPDRPHERHRSDQRFPRRPMKPSRPVHRPRAARRPRPRASKSPIRPRKSFPMPAAPSSRTRKPARNWSPAAPKLGRRLSPYLWLARRETLRASLPPSLAGATCRHRTDRLASEALAAAAWSPVGHYRPAFKSRRGSHDAGSAHQLCGAPALLFGSRRPAGNLVAAAADPAKPRRPSRFAPLAMLARVTEAEETPARSPWWLTACCVC